MKVKVKYGELDHTFNGVSSTATINNFMKLVKKQFNLEGTTCSLWLGETKLKSSKSFNNQSIEVNNGSVLEVRSTGKPYRAPKNEDDMITFRVEYDGKFESFTVPRQRQTGSFLNKNAKPVFNLEECDCQLKSNDEKILVCVDSLEANGVSSDSILTLCICKRQKWDPEGETRTICGLDLTVKPINPNKIKIADSAGLYAILRKSDEFQQEKPLKSVCYIGTRTTTSLKDRFDEHCKPKNVGSSRFVFNSREYCIVSLMEFDAENLEQRFDEPNQAAIAYELLSAEIREECSFVSKWSPGTGCLEYNASAFSKLNRNDLEVLVKSLLVAIESELSEYTM